MLYPNRRPAWFGRMLLPRGAIVGALAARAHRLERPIRRTRPFGCDYDRLGAGGVAQLPFTVAALLYLYGPGIDGNLNVASHTRYIDHSRTCLSRWPGRYDVGESQPVQPTIPTRRTLALRIKHLLNVEMTFCCWRFSTRHADTTPRAN